MPSDTLNLGPEIGNARTFNGKPQAQLPKEVQAAILAAVRQAINALRREVEAKRPRTVVEKKYNVAPGALEESVRIHGALCQENERAERLLLQLRQARAELLKASGQ